MKKILLYTIMSSVFIPLFAQYKECAFVMSPTDYALLLEFKNNITNPSLLRASRISTANNVDNICTFSVQHHIVRTSSGTGGLSTSAISTIVQELNNVYDDAGIQFSTIGIDYIDNDIYYNFDGTEEYSLRSTYNNPNAINIYYFNSVTLNGQDACGYAYYPLNNINFIAIDKYCATNGSTVIHEMGHFFGLLHTHDTNYGYEDPNGSNCSSTGDLCCDTPADPTLSQDNVNSNCVYTGTATYDGRPYTPDTHNFMSYSRKTCRNIFSDEQIDFIFEWSKSTERKNFLNPVSLQNQTISSTVTIEACKDINVQNVTVTNGAKLTLDAENRTVINGAFEVELGSELEIK